VNATAFLGLMLIANGNAAASDELCGRLEAFEQEVALPGQHLPQWFDVYWATDRNAIFSVGCKHRKAPAAKEVCSWLPTHMSMEFAGMLPKRISACYGLDAARFGPGKFPRKAIKFKSKLGNRLLLQTGESSDGAPWMRFAVVPAGSKRSVKNLPKPNGYEK
jgi:hypothetical protein